MSAVIARIAISYHKDSKSQVLQIAHALREFRFDVCLVEKSMHQDIFKKLEEALRNSAVVLVCLTSKYERSEECRMELTYASNLKKKLIPIYLEKSYRASGEVAKIVAEKRYIDFTDRTEFCLNAKILKIEIENRLANEGVAANPENICMQVEDLGATGMDAYAGHASNFVASPSEKRMDANAEDASNAVTIRDEGTIAQSYTEIQSLSSGVSISGGNIKSQLIRMDTNTGRESSAVAHPSERRMDDNIGNASNTFADPNGRSIPQSHTCIRSMSESVSISGGNINTQVIFQSSRAIVALYTRKDIGMLKKRYKGSFKKHQLHMVDEKNCIVPREINIDLFAVKVRLSGYLPPMDTYSNEARQHFENLNRIPTANIELSHLINKEKRVTFIRGIAGMGKTVLAKRVAYGWANNDMYKNFDGCLMIECREINFFLATEGKKQRFEKHKLFEEFVKRKFKYDFGDGDGILFVIDGLDELSDINEPESMIKGLLLQRTFCHSIVILTGRPHIERKLDEIHQIGGLHKLEIQGLGNQEIKEYAEKFNSLQFSKVDLTKAKDSSKRFYPIMHIPHFLNTFCCTAAMLKGETICNTAELYSWTVYLLLKQHAAKEQPHIELVCEIFEYYSIELLNLGKVCYDLLSENKIILLKKDIASLYFGIENKRAFFDSLFVDASDNFDRRVQFAHLSIMEFLSAFHICSSPDRNKLVCSKLQKNSIETVVLACQLMEGFRYSKIIQPLFMNAAKLETIDVRAFFTHALEQLQQCELDEIAKFRALLDILASVLKTETIEKNFMVNNVRKLNCNFIDSSVQDSKKISDIYNYLCNTEACKDIELKEVFNNVRFEWFVVNEVEMLLVVKYLKKVNGIVLIDKTINVNVAESTVKSVIDGGQCTRVSINNCEWIDCEVQEENLHSKLVRLTISGCTFSSTRSFVNAVQWAIRSCDRVQLWFLSITHAWWRKLAEAIQNESRSIEELHIYGCTPPMANRLQKKIVQSGLILFIDGIEITAPSQQMPAATDSNLSKIKNKLKTGYRHFSTCGGYLYTLAIIGVIAAVMFYFYFKHRTS